MSFVIVGCLAVNLQLTIRYCCQVGHLKNRLPGTNAWIFLKFEDNNKKP